MVVRSWHECARLLVGVVAGSLWLSGCVGEPQQTLTLHDTTSPASGAMQLDLGPGLPLALPKPLSRATTTSPPENFVSSLLVSVSINPDIGAAEAVCPASGPIEHVEQFKGSTAFPKQMVNDLQRTTVRISFQPSEQLARTVREDLKLKRVDLGAFTGFEKWNRGVCTGTLITRNIVLTAGHCVSPVYWEMEQKQRVPRIAVNGDETRPMTAKELARLMQIEFNYQNRYLAEVDAFQPAGSRVDRLTARVVELISADYRDYNEPSAVDYALLRIETVDQDARDRLEAAALGLGRLQYTPQPQRDPIAIVQHPGGFEKKVATGTLLGKASWRLYYNDLSTEGGSSGAGVFSNNGRLVGIHTRGGCGLAERGAANKGMSILRLRDIISALQRTP